MTLELLEVLQGLKREHVERDSFGVGVFTIIYVYMPEFRFGFRHEATLEPDLRAANAGCNTGCSMQIILAKAQSLPLHAQLTALNFPTF
jgi:hypothetical protein